MTDQLHDEEAFKPENLFDAKKFNTVLVNREGFTSKQNETADLIVQLLDPAITRSESEDIFRSLFKSKAQAMLVESIRNAAASHEKQLLVAACWESGLDFSAEYGFFAGLVCQQDFALAMEAFTVIQEMSDPPHEAMEQTLSDIGKMKDLPNAIVNELRMFIQAKLHEE